MRKNERQRLARRKEYLQKQFQQRIPALLTDIKKRWHACRCGDPMCPYTADLLADMELLDGAVLPIPENIELQEDLYRWNLLAVPVGGRRRGGYVPVADAAEAQRVIDVLKNKPGFPDLRCGVDEDCVEWGEPKPKGDHVSLGRYYGYSDAAIENFSKRPICDCDDCRGNAARSEAAAAA
jgi:hypothetical protein